MIKEKIKILQHPVTIIISLLIGILIGIFFKDQALKVEPIGNLYVTLLQMCVIPVMVSSITVSIGRLVRNKSNNNDGIKLVGTFIAFAIGTAIISIIIAFIFKGVLEPSVKTKSAIGEAVISQGISGENSLAVVKEISSTGLIEIAEEQTSIMDFVVQVVPSNIFKALTDGDMLKIIFFFIILGSAMQFLPKEYYNQLIVVFEALAEAFSKIIEKIILLLPIALIALISNQVAKTGYGLLISLLNLAGIILGVGLILFFISSIIIWKRSNKKYVEQFKYLKEAIMISIFTRSSYAAIPYAAKGIKETIDGDGNKSNLAVNLGVAIFRYGSIMIFTVCSVFAIYLFNKELTFNTIIIIIVASIFAATATSGAPGIIGLTLIDIVLVSLGLPTGGAMFIVMLTLIPVIDPIDTIINVYPNCAVAAINSNISKKEVDVNYEAKTNI